MLNHLKCAVFETSIHDGELFGMHDLLKCCKFLEELRFVHHSAGAWHWTSDTYPADAVSFAQRDQRQLRVIDTTGDHKVIAEVAVPRGAYDASPEGDLSPRSASIPRREVRLRSRKAYVKRVDCDYFTDAIDYHKSRNSRRFDQPRALIGVAAHGEVRVNTQVVGFKKIKFYTLENVGPGRLSMPEQEMHTTSFWLHFPSAFLNNSAISRRRTAKTQSPDWATLYARSGRCC